ncbi:MAG: alpha-L-fucosidase, partial [Clostridium sp.]
MNKNIQWFKEAKFGMMIHWGLYSLLAGEHKGEKSSVY